MSRGIFTVLALIRENQIFINECGAPVFESSTDTRPATLQDAENVYHSPEWRKVIVAKKVF